MKGKRETRTVKNGDKEDKCMALFLSLLLALMCWTCDWIREAREEAVVFVGLGM